MAAYGASNAFAPGRFNIWLPNRPQNAYLSFDTLPEAQADAQAKQGVIMNPSAQVDPSVQAWAGWSQFQTALPQGTVVLNPTAAPGTPVGGPAGEEQPGRRASGRQVQRLGPGGSPAEARQRVGDGDHHAVRRVPPGRHPARRRRRW